MSDGLFSKYRVERVDGRDKPGGDKADAEYFVLDYVHDGWARMALAAYADACESELPTLAADLRRKLRIEAWVSAEETRRDVGGAA